MKYDELAERYLDKTFPDTKGYAPSDEELKQQHDVDPTVYRQLDEAFAHLSQQLGRRPTTDELVRAATQRMYADRRRGI